MDSCDQSNYPSKPPLNPYTHMAYVVVGCCGSKNQPMFWISSFYRCPIQGVSFVRGWFFERHQSVTRRRLFTPTWGPRSPRKISKSLMKLALYIFLNRFFSNGIPPKICSELGFSHIFIDYTPKSILHGIFPYFPRRNCYSCPPLQTAQPRAASRAPGVFLHRRVANAQANKSACVLVLEVQKWQETMGRTW